MNPYNLLDYLDAGPFVIELLPRLRGRKHMVVRGQLLFEDGAALRWWEVIPNQDYDRLLRAFGDLAEDTDSE